MDTSTDTGLSVDLKKRLRIDLISEAEQFSQFREILDQGFSLKPNQHYLDDFPVWGPNNLGNNILRAGIYFEEKLLSTACLRFCDLALNLNGKPQSIKIGMIGAVSTLPSWRKKGLASQLISFLSQVAREQDLAFVSVWGSELALYERMGFSLCGQQVRLSLQGLNPPPKEIEIETGWNSGIFSLLQQRIQGVKLDKKSDLAWYSSHKNVQWFYTRNNQNEVDSCVAFGRGIDLDHYVHEWAGSIEKVNAILQKIGKIDPNSHIIGMPDSLRDLGFLFSKNQIEFLCQAKLFNPKSLIQAIHPSRAIQAESTSENDWKVSIGNKLYEFTHAELTRFLFGPSVDGTGGEEESYFPLPICIWGLDAC